MIGRTEPVRPFELIRWARAQARAHELRPIEAHVLLLLATYANDEAKAWPSIRTLALDAGLKPKRIVSQSKLGGGDAWGNSTVSAALARLEKLQLIWTTGSGRGRPAVRELLFNPLPSVSAEGKPSEQPSVSTEGRDGLPSASAEGRTPAPPASAFRADGRKPSALTDTKGHSNGQSPSGLQLPNKNGQRMPSADAEGIGSVPTEGGLEGRAVSAIVAEALGVEDPPLPVAEREAIAELGARFVAFNLAAQAPRNAAAA